MCFTGCHKLVMTCVAPVAPTCRAFSGPMPIQNHMRNGSKVCFLALILGSKCHRVHRRCGVYKLGGIPVELWENRCKKSVCFKLHQRYQPALSFQDSTLSLLLGYILCIPVHIPCCCRIFVGWKPGLWNRTEHLRLRCFESDPIVFLSWWKGSHFPENRKGRLRHDPQIPTSKRLPTFLRCKTFALKVVKTG